MSEQYKPLYPPEGGPLRGFACYVIMEKLGQCETVTRTERGMLMHLKAVHGIVIQREMFTEAENDKQGQIV